MNTGIRVIQLNANKKSDVVNCLLNIQLPTADLILLQEPNWGRIGSDETGNDVVGPVGHTAWTPILPIPANRRQDPVPRVMAYAKRREEFEVTPRTDIVQDRDILALDISYRHQHIATIINIYNDPSLSRESAACNLRGLNLPANQSIIITGDWNLHHPLWSPLNHASHHQVTEEVVDWLSSKGFTLLNEKGAITYTPHSGQRGSPSVIDLTFVNPIAMQTDLVREWAINPHLSYGSDHAALTWSLNTDNEEVVNPRGTKYNLKEVDPTKWKEAFATHLPRYTDYLNKLHSSLPITPEDLDGAAEALTKAMEDATREIAPLRKPSPMAKPWWSEDLTKAAATRTTRMEKNSRHTLPILERQGSQNTQLLQTSMQNCKAQVDY